MALVNPYITLAELKGVLTAGQQVTYKAEDEANMETAINAMSRLIDMLAKTTFYARTETRYFTPDWYDLLHLPDDMISVTTLKTDEDGDGTYEITWATTDYWLEPRNARVNADDAQKRPYRQIRVNPEGDYTFPTNRHHAIEIVGSWGYTNEVPATIKQNMLLAANRVYRRKDAIFGVAGSPALGVQIIQARIQQDSDIMMLLNQGIDHRGF